MSGSERGGRVLTRYGERVAETLEDLVEFGGMAVRLVARGKGCYDTDETMRLAAEAILHRIGEAVSRLPDEFVAAHPAVEWRLLKATRNIVAHQYARIDHDIIWAGPAGKIPGGDRVHRGPPGALSPRQDSSTRTPAGRAERQGESTVIPSDVAASSIRRS